MPPVLCLMGGLVAGDAGLAQTPDTSGQDKAAAIFIGVRADARPFAYYDAENDSFAGFLVDICINAVVSRAKYSNVTLERVTASERADIFNGGRQVDLFCDPTTMTLARLREIGEVEPAGRLAFSPIVFLANGSYLRRERQVEGRTEYAGLMEKEGAGWRPIGQADADGQMVHGIGPVPEESCVFGPEPPRSEDADDADDAGAAEARSSDYKVYAAGFLTGSTSSQNFRRLLAKESLGPRAGEAFCPIEFENHTALTAAFCEGHLQRYFGDLDIIRANLLHYVETVGNGHRASCPFDKDTEPLSYEPYAFVVSNRVPGFREEITRAIYEVFHDGSALQLYHGRFGETPPMSNFLKQLFLINAIPAGSVAAVSE